MTRTDSTPQTDQDTQATTDQRSSAEEWVERIATYWANAWLAAWRTVFPRREGTR